MAAVGALTVGASGDSVFGKLRSLAQNRVVVLIAGIALGVLLWTAPWHRFASAAGHAVPHRRPYEYLYLDSERVDSFLGELDDGSVRSFSRQETESSNASLGFQLDTVGSATATEGKQLTVSAVVTKTEADNFYSLLEQLEGGMLKTVNMASPRLSTQLSQRAVPIGTMVRIENAFPRLPPYLSSYPLLRYARFETGSPAFEKPLLSDYSLSRYTAGGAVERERLTFIKRVGPDPRLPFSVEAGGGLTILIPARFADLTGDPSLLSARLTIVGKVAFNVEKGPETGQDEEKGFGDGASEDAYLPALLAASPTFLRELGVRPAAAHSKKALFQGVSESLTYLGHVVEVVPVAIYYN
jgi:hypothetical protein